MDNNPASWSAEDDSRTDVDERVDQLSGDPAVGEQAASAIRRAYDLVLAGESPQSIASTWNAAGVPIGPRGLPQRTGQRGEWTADAVRAVLMDPRNAGPAGLAGRPDTGRATPAAPTQLVSEEVWRRAVEILLASPGPSTPEPAAALLIALAQCGICGQPVVCELVSAGQLAYRCNGDDGRAHLARSAAPVDSWIRLLVIERLDRPGAPDLLADPDRSDLYALRAQSGGLRARRAQLEDAVSDGTVDESEAGAAIGRLDAELASVEDQMVDHSRRDVPTSLTGADPVGAAWDRLATSRQRGVLLALTERITLCPVPDGHRPGDPDVLRETAIVKWRTT
jgi:site-specific DNA recombinase